VFWLPFIQDYTPIILDLSDIARPLEKRMHYLATLRDGGIGELVNAYYAHRLPSGPKTQQTCRIKKIRTFRWSAICRPVSLAVLVMIYLGWPVEEHPNICDRLVYLGQPLPHNPNLLPSCLLAPPTEAINTCFWLHRDLLRKSLREKPPKFELKRD